MKLKDSFVAESHLYYNYSKDEKEHLKKLLEQDIAINLVKYLRDNQDACMSFKFTETLKHEQTPYDFDACTLTLRLDIYEIENYTCMKSIPIKRTNIESKNNERIVKG